MEFFGDFLKDDERNLIFRVILHALLFSVISFMSAAVIIVVATELLGGGPNNTQEKIDFVRHIFGKIIFVPFFETLIFQLSIIVVLSKIKILKPYIIVLISALVFSLSHGLSKAIVIFPLGIVLAYVFCYWKNVTYSISWAFCATYLTHIFHNTYSLTLNCIL